MKEFSFERSDTIWDLKDDLMKLVAPLCLFMPLCSLSAYLFLGLYSVFTKLPLEKLSEGFIKSGFYPFYSLFISSVPLFLCIFLVLKLTHRPFSPISIKPTVSKKSFLLFVFASFGTLLIASVITAFTNGLLSDLGFKNLSMLPVPKGFFEIFVFILSHVVLAPLLEEFLFRGIIFEHLRRYGSLFSVIISSLLFSFMHGSFTSLLSSFFMGVVFSLLALYTGSYAASLVLHILNNLLVVLQIILSSALTKAQCDKFVIISLIALFIISVFTLIFIAVKKPNFYNIQKQQSAVSPLRRAIIFICSPAVLFFIFSFLISAVAELGGLL